MVLFHHLLREKKDVFIGVHMRFFLLHFIHLDNRCHKLSGILRRLYSENSVAGSAGRRVYGAGSEADDPT